LLEGQDADRATWILKHASFDGSNTRRVCVEPAMKFQPRLPALLLICGGVVLLPGACDDKRPISNTFTPTVVESPRESRGDGPYRRPEPTGYAIAVQQVRFLPDNKRIVTLDTDRVTLWDRDGTYKYVGLEPTTLGSREFVIAPAKMLSMDISPDGSRILTGSDDGYLRVLDLATGRQLDEYKLDEPNEAYVVGFRAEGHEAVTVSLTGHRVRVWDLRNHKLLEEYAGPGIGPRTADSVLSPDRKRLLIVYGNQHGATEFTLEPDPNQSATNYPIGRDATGQWMKRGRFLGGHESSRVWALYLESGRKGLTSDGITTRLWDMTTGECLKTLPGLPGSVIRGTTWWSIRPKEPPDAFERGFSIVGVDAETGQSKEEILAPKLRGPLRGDLSPDGRYLALAGVPSRPLLERTWSFSAFGLEVIRDLRALHVWDRQEMKWHRVTEAEWEH
jgi:WD40 repeat protein